MYSALIPPAFQALDRAEHLLNIVETSDRAEALLSARLHADMFDFATQLEIVAGFSLRVCLPPLGRSVPELSGPVSERLSEAKSILSALTPEDFHGTTQKVIAHQAGFAKLEQSADDYATLFALPNLWFHLSMAYAILRAEGLPLTKGDFDGLHGYPAGFSWEA